MPSITWALQHVFDAISVASFSTECAKVARAILLDESERPRDIFERLTLGRDTPKPTVSFCCPVQTPDEMRKNYALFRQRISIPYLFYRFARKVPVHEWSNSLLNARAWMSSAFVLNFADT